MRGGTARKLLGTSAAVAALLLFGVPHALAQTVVINADRTTPVPDLPDGTSFENSAKIEVDFSALPPLDPGIVPAVHGLGDVPSFINQATGVISNDPGAGDQAIAVVVDGSVGSFINLGSIDGNDAVRVAGRVGSFTNGGNITAYNWAVISDSMGSFVNTGTIDAFFGLTTGQIDSFINRGTFLSTNTAVTIGLSGQPSGYVENAGSIESSYYGFLVYGDVRTFVNSGDITSFNSTGISFGGSVGSFTNTGYVEGAQSAVIASSITTFTNGFDGMINAGEDAVHVSGDVGSFFNAGMIGGTERGVVIDGMTNTFRNDGLLGGTDAAVVLGSVGSFVNGANAAIGSSTVGVSLGSAQSFTNSGLIGTIDFDSVGVLSTGHVGEFVNTGTGMITADYGVALNSAGRVINAGLIEAYEAGIAVGIDVPSFTTVNTASVDIFNMAGGIIDATACGCGGGGVGVAFVNGTLTNYGEIYGAVGVGVQPTVAGKGVTIVNAGTIYGDEAAISFDLIEPPYMPGTGSGPDREDTLKLLAGSDIFGTVDFGAGFDTLDLSQYQGTMVLSTVRLENIIRGSSLIFDDSQGASGAVVAFDETGQKIAPVVLYSSIAGFIQTGIDGALAGQGATAASGGTLNYLPVLTPAAQAAADELAAPLDPATTVWGSAFGGLTSNVTPGTAFDQLLGGLVAGAHTAVDSNLRLGGVVSIATSTFVTPSPGQTIGSDTGTLGLYGDYDIGGMTLDFSLFGGASMNRSTRDITTFMGPATLSAEYASWFISPQLGLSIPVPVLEGLDTEVGLSVRYLGGRVAAHTEDGILAVGGGGGPISISVPEENISAFEARAEIRGETTIASGEYGDTVLTATAGGLGQLNASQSSGSVVLDSGVGALNTSGALFAVGGYASLGVATPIGPAASLSLTGGGEYRTDGIGAFSANATLTGGF